MTIGARIKYIRLKKNMTQKHVAEKCGIADSAIRKYESGAIKPKFETLQKIAKALEVPVGELMGLEYMGGEFWGKEAEPDVYEKFAKNIEKFHGNKGPKTTNNEILETDLNPITSCLKKMNKSGLDVLLRISKTLSEMPEYQKDNKEEQNRENCDPKKEDKK